VNVDDANVETSKITSNNTIPLECFTPYPPYKLYGALFIVALVVLVYVLFVSRL
jgi:hypothetical protein